VLDVEQGVRIEALFGSECHKVFKTCQSRRAKNIGVAGPVVLCGDKWMWVATFSVSPIQIVKERRNATPSQIV